MKINNVKASWLFLDQPDDNSNYRVSFLANKELEKQIDAELSRVAKENGFELDKLDWKGSKKKDEESGLAIYTAKASSQITRKNGETVERKLSVYDIHAERMANLQKIANGATINLVVEPYFVKYKQKKGVMLGLRSVQLLGWQIYEGENPYEDMSPNGDQDLKGSGDIFEEEQDQLEEAF